MRIFDFVLFSLLVVIITTLQSEMRREPLSMCSLKSLSSGDLVFFSTRSSSLKRQINLCVIRLFTRTEFDHVGLIIKKDGVPYVMDRRKNGYVSLLPIKRRLLQFNGYVAIRHRNEAIKNENMLWDICTHISKQGKGRAFNYMRFVNFVLHPNKIFIPWMSCNDLIHEVMSMCDEPTPVLFPCNILKKCIEYGEAQLLKYF